MHLTALAARRYRLREYRGLRVRLNLPLATKLLVYGLAGYDRNRFAGIVRRFDQEYSHLPPSPVLKKTDRLFTTGLQIMY